MYQQLRCNHCENRSTTWLHDTDVQLDPFVCRTCWRPTCVWVHKSMSYDDANNARHRNSFQTYLEIIRYYDLRPGPARPIRLPTVMIWSPSLTFTDVVVPRVYRVFRPPPSGLQRALTIEIGDLVITQDTAARDIAQGMIWAGVIEWTDAHSLAQERGFTVDSWGITSTGWVHIHSLQPVITQPAQPDDEPPPDAPHSPDSISGQPGHQTDSANTTGHGSHLPSTNQPEYAQAHQPGSANDGPANSMTTSADMGTATRACDTNSTNCPDATSAPNNWMTELSSNARDSTTLNNSSPTQATIETSISSTQHIQLQATTWPWSTADDADEESPNATPTVVRHPFMINRAAEEPWGSLAAAAPETAADSRHTQSFYKRVRLSPDTPSSSSTEGLVSDCN